MNENIVFTSSEEEIKYLRKQILIEREKHEKIEENLKRQLEFSLKTCENLSQELDKAVFIAQKLKIIANDKDLLIDNEKETEILNEINSMMNRSKKINIMCKEYRAETEKSQKKYIKIRNSISFIFESIIASSKNVPQFSKEIIKIAKEVDTQSTESLINAIIKSNNYLLSCLVSK